MKWAEPSLGCLLAALSLALLDSCGGSIPHTVEGSEAFFKLSDREQAARLSEFSPADQVGLYLTSRYFEPPYYGIGDAVAGRGAKVLPAILDRLTRGPDWEVPGLLYLLIKMDKGNHYSVAQDKHAVSVIRGRFDAVTIPQVKELCEGDMAELEALSGAP
jgi:hypothetical protein